VPDKDPQPAQGWNAFTLAPLNVELVIAENGEQAVEAFGAGGFDAVLMDMMMPVMDGLAATHAIRALEAAHGMARTPIAMLSANAMPEHTEQALGAGCDAHIAKPVTPKALIAGLEALMAKAQPLGIDAAA
jgi:CheY-like chemotaxis protein